MFELKSAVARPVVARGRTKEANPFVAGMPNLVKISEKGLAFPVKLTGDDALKANRERILRKIREAARIVDAQGIEVPTASTDKNYRPVWSLTTQGSDDYVEGSGEPYIYNVWLTPFVARPRKDKNQDSTPAEAPASE